MKSTLTSIINHCRICNDEASGVHYGVLSCNSCKLFFNRSVLFKYQSYFCFNNKSCEINSTNRIKCKYCRFQKCLTEGMSIQKIRLGRNQKTSINNNEILIKDDTKSNQSALITYRNKNEDDCILIEDDEQSYGSELEIINPRNEHLDYWLKLQLESVMNETIKAFSELDITNQLRLKLDFDDYCKKNENEQMIISKETNDYFNRNPLFASLIENSECIIKFSSDREFYFTTTLKNITYHCYNKHIKQSIILNNAYKRLANNAFINEYDPNVTSQLIWEGLGQTISEFTKWLFTFTKELQGFNKLNQQDLLKIISAAVFALNPIHTNCLFDTVINEYLMILHNSIQLTKKRKLQACPSNIVDLVFTLHNLFKKLELTESELALFYPFVLLSCESANIENKLTFFKLKYMYTKCFYYAFVQNRRDSRFYQNLKDFFENIRLLEMNKINILDQSSKLTF